MKQLLFIFLTFFSFLSCDSKNNQQTIIKSNNKMTKIEYNITFSFKNIGFQVFVNDILVEQRYNGGMNNSFNINEYLNDQEVQKIKIRLFKTDNSNITKEDISVQECAIFRNNKDTDEFTTFHKIIFQTNKGELPFFEINDEIRIKDKTPLIATDLLKGAVDISKIDKKILEKNVKEKFEKLRTDLNNGDYNIFFKEIEMRNNNYFKSNYYNDLEIQKYMTSATNTLKEYKEKMLPIENYRMIISGNGKLVTFERIDKEYLGDCVLLAKDTKDKVLFLNYITLFIPQNEQELKIYNMNAKATSLE